MHLYEKQNDMSCFLRKWTKSQFMIKTKTNICQKAQKNQLNTKGNHVFIPHWQISVLVLSKNSLHFVQILRNKALFVHFNM